MARRAHTHLVDDLKDARAGPLHQLLVGRPQALGKQTQKPVVHHLRDVYPTDEPFEGKQPKKKKKEGEKDGGGGVSS